MRSFVLALLILTSAIILLLSASDVVAQGDGDRWLRVVTAEGSVIDVDSMSLVIEPDRIFRANFRTTLSRPESLPDKGGRKYKSRLDSIQFNLSNFGYRIAESTLYDPSGDVVSRSSAADSNWKYKGPTGQRLFGAARQLYPFGVWRIVAYRYANGAPPSPDDPRELTSLIGRAFWLYWDEVRTTDRSSRCSTPVFETKSVANDEFLKKTGTPLSSLGILTDRVEVLALRCDSGDKFQPQTLIFPLSRGKARVLWDGVFLDVEREKNLFQTF